MRKVYYIFLIAMVMVSATNIAAAEVFSLDFSKAEGDVEQWFAKKGWNFEANISDMSQRFEGGKLVIEAKDEDYGVIAKQFKQGKYINAKRVRIEWGVEQYPKGADWSGPKNDKRNTRSPIEFKIIFGEETKESGGFLIPPDLPYFLSFFLGEKEDPNKIYFGNYYHEGGRYFCIPCDGSKGTTFVTEVNLSETFKKVFKEDILPVTGLSIEVDTKDTERVNGRHSKAFIKRVQFFDE